MSGPARSDTVARLVREAVEALDRAADQPTDHLSEEAAVALRAAVRLRDALIELRRAELSWDERAAMQTDLDLANAVISVVSGVAYPADKLERGRLRQAREALEPLLDL